MIFIFLLYHTKEYKGTTTLEGLYIYFRELYHTKEYKGTTTKNGQHQEGYYYIIPKNIRELQQSSE